MRRKRVSGQHICDPNSILYYIQYGDTLYRLANEYGTTVDAIMELNPYVNPYNLQVGQPICIPW